jgi:UDP-4-amino-4,6-dideoxy-N-acetyl-beta-L-altrosamine transaminase
MRSKINNNNVFIPFHKPSIGEEEISEVVDTLHSGWLTTGPKTKLFEKKICAYIGCKHAIAVSSCTAGLHLSLVAAGIGNGDEVITTPYTFASTAAVIIHVGARPVFVDIKNDDFNINPINIRKAITKNTKAIIPVHFAGNPCEMEEILSIAKKYNLIVIEDAAHAIGAEYNEKKIGNIGDITVFSFYAIKNLTTGEGGMITTNNKRFADKIRMLSLVGISKDAWKRYTSEGSWYYEVQYAGFKYNMTDIQASLGIHQLKKLDEFIIARRQYAQLYNSAFKPIHEINTPTVKKNTRHAWHLYVIQLNNHKFFMGRNKFINVLKEKKIGTSVHFIPLHLHPYYKKKYLYKTGDYPIAERKYSNAISLPLHPNLTKDDLEYIIYEIKKTILTARE